MAIGNWAARLVYNTTTITCVVAMAHVKPADCRRLNEVYMHGSALQFLYLDHGTCQGLTVHGPALRGETNTITEGMVQCWDAAKDPVA